jgi:glucose/arabinose dehydrogenase
MQMKMVTIGAVCGCLLLSLGALSAADKQTAEKQKAQAASAKPKAAPSPSALPPGAVQTAAGTYSYTDPQGKKWTYRQTPFGMAKIEERDTSAAAAEIEKKQAEQTHAFEDGDSIRFERPGPFGVYSWKQKKAELNSLEQTVWNRDRGRQPGAREKE